MRFEFDKVNNLNDVVVISPVFSQDSRGMFMKIFETTEFQFGSIKFDLSEAFISVSKKNVIRGLHFQYYLPQTKLVTVLNGSCMDVLVDLRKNSSTYLNYKFFELNDINRHLLYIPKGYAHGFLSLTDDMRMLYMCDGAYDKESDTGLLYNDDKLGIKWPIDDISKTIHSERDLNLMTLDEFETMGLFLEL